MAPMIHKPLRPQQFQVHIDTVNDQDTDYGDMPTEARNLFQSTAIGPKSEISVSFEIRNSKYTELT
jgi:hypothetical protein